MQIKSTKCLRTGSPLTHLRPPWPSPRLTRSAALNKCPLRWVREIPPDQGVGLAHVRVRHLAAGSPTGGPHRHTVWTLTWHDYMPDRRDDPLLSSHQPWKGGAATSPSKTYQEAEAWGPAKLLKVPGKVACHVSCRSRLYRARQPASPRGHYQEDVNWLCPSSPGSTHGWEFSHTCPSLETTNKGTWIRWVAGVGWTDLELSVPWATWFQTEHLPH